MCTTSSKDIQQNKKVENARGSREIFSRLSSAFTDFTEQQIPRPVDEERRKMYYSGKKKRHTIVKNQITVNNRGYILHKVGYKKGRKHDYDIYKKNYPVFQKRLLL